ncbi:retinaldehyde-binding protein 1-like [Symsagittifera roscoffensis]|uniref:retinaldehyde-binding protein 1-like n=1 Tax=Symsagittifera roscoffensis TaxID=84072 RepID=UPI00307CC6DC
MTLNGQTIDGAIFNNAGLLLDEPWNSLAIEKVNEEPSLVVQKCSTVIAKIQTNHPKLLFNPDLNFILRFLRLRKYDTDKAYKEIISLYEFQKVEKLCHNLLPSECEHIFKLLVGAVMPGYDKQLRKLLILHIGLWNTDETKLWDAFRALLIVLEVIASDPVSQITGLSVIVDFKDFTLKHLSHVKFSLARTIVKAIQETIPIRVKALYFINASSFLTSLISTIKVLLSSKIRKRFHVLAEKREKGDRPLSEILCEDFGPEVLPRSLGGVADVNEDPYEITCNLMLQQQTYFENLMQYGF